MCFKGSFDLILIDPRGRYPPGIPSQTQVISRSLPYESHHLFSDGVFEDWLEPSEQWGCIIRCGKQFITGDIVFWNMFYHRAENPYFDACTTVSHTCL